MSFLPAMTGNGLYIPPYTTYKNGTGGWCKWPCFTHISLFSDATRKTECDLPKLHRWTREE